MKHLPLALTTLAIVVTLIICTGRITDRLDHPAHVTLDPLDLGGIDKRLDALEHYTCSIGRTLDLVEVEMPSRGPSKEFHMPEPCPGDPGQERQF